MMMSLAGIDYTEVTGRLQATKTAKRRIFATEITRCQQQDEDGGRDKYQAQGGRNRIVTAIGKGEE